jgi:hypothetical protein
MPSDSSTSALPERLVAARLPCLATRTPHAAATSAAPVDKFKLPEPSPPVPQVSSSFGKSCTTGTIAARIAAAAAATISAVSPRWRSATKIPPICDGVQAPAKMASNTARVVASLKPRSLISSA